MTKYSSEMTMLFGRRVVKLGQSKLLEVSLLAENDTTIPAKLHLVRKDGDGDPYLEAAVSFSPVSDAAHERASQTEKMAAIGILAAGLAHDISDPTSCLREQIPKLRRAFDEILPILERTYESNRELEIAELRYPDFKKEFSDMMADMASGAERIAKIVDYFRGLSYDGRDGDGKPIDLGEVLRSCVILTEDLRDDTDITLDLAINGPIIEVVGDREKLQYIFLNVFFKAHALLGDNPGDITVNVYSEDPGKCIRVEIQAAASEKKCDGPQRKTAAAPPSLDFGLGSIHKLLKPLGGRFGMRSVCEGGTVFQIELPISRSEQDDILDERPVVVPLS